MVVQPQGEGIMLAFEGTSTQQRYVVGRSYEMNGAEYVARKDGAFVNAETGQVLRGSAGNPDVKWYASGADLVRSAGEGGGAAAVVNQAVTQNEQAPPDGAAPVPPPVKAEVTAGNRGAFLSEFLRTEEFSGRNEPVQDLYLFGKRIYAHPGFINADMAEVRYADIGSNLIGLANLGADMGYTMSRYAFGPNHENVDKGAVLQQRAAAAAGDVGSLLLETGMQVYDSVQDAADKQRDFERVRDLTLMDLRDANALRDRLTWEEADRYARTLREDQYLGHMGLPQGSPERRFMGVGPVTKPATPAWPEAFTSY